MIRPILDDPETVWDILEAIFQTNGDWREENPTPNYLLLREAGWIIQSPSGEWALTDEGLEARNVHFGPPRYIDPEDHEEVEKKLEEASKDCRRLAATLQFTMFMIAEDQKYLLITGRGPQLSLGDIVDGALALHQRGEGDWW